MSQKSSGHCHKYSFILKGRISGHWPEKGKIDPLKKKNGEMVWEDTKVLLMVVFVQLG